MKKLLITFSAFIFSLSIFAQADTTYWKTEGDFSIQFNQVSFSNWATGGDNSYAGVIGLNYSFNYAKDKSTWDNKLILAYGMQSLDGDLRKTEDKIDFSSKYGRKINDKIYFGTLFTLKTQFANGYNYPNTTDYISQFAAPIYIGIGPGIDFKPNKFLSIFVSPATVQWVIISDTYLSNLGVFGNAPGENVRTQFGAAVKLQFKKDIAKNINLDTKVELFSDYLNNPQNIIINWDVILDMKVNKLISAKITTGLIYDHNIIIMDDAGNPLGPRTQFKEMFGAGLSVKF
ncbi:MAG: DUF3078 domain-containing protein [Bacteroidales bacterium]|nr:DUF3078 domain-containing protein [Bacteroidales bacterium]